jgi:hypothetical protein
LEYRPFGYTTADCLIGSGTVHSFPKAQGGCPWVSGNELSEVPVALALRKKKFVSAVARHYETVNGYYIF